MHHLPEADSRRGSRNSVFINNTYVDSAWVCMFISGDTIPFSTPALVFHARRWLVRSLW